MLKKSLKEIMEANSRLEKEVSIRTQELVKTKERLQREIEEHKLVQEALRESEERFKLTESAGYIGSWDWNILSGELLWSDMIEPLFGFKRGEFEGSYESFLNSVHPDDRQFLIDSVNAAVDEGEDYSIEHRIVWPEKAVRWVSEKGSVIRDDGGQAVRMLGIIQDITERKQAADELRESEQKYKSVVENIGVGVSLISPDMEIMALNRQMKEWFPHINVSKRPTCYKAFNDPPRETECSYCPTNKTLIDGKVYESVTETPAGDETLHFRIVSSPIKDDNGRVVAAIELVENITEQKRAEEDLRRNRLYFQNLDRISRAISRASDVDSMVREVVKEILGIFEVDRAWLLYPCDPEAPSWRVPVEVTVPEYPGAFAEQADMPKSDTSSSVFRKALATDDPVAFDFSESGEVSESLQRFNIQTQLVIALRPKVGEAWLLGMHQCSYKRPWDDDDKRLFKDIAERVRDSLTNLVLLKQLEEDITKRKQTEEALRISEERYALAIEGSNDGIWERNLATGETYFSPRWKEIIGYGDDELPNHLDEWKKRVHPDDYDMVIKNIDDYLAGTIDRYICEYRIRHKDDSWHWMLAKGAKTCDDQKNPTHFAGSHTDITERKKGEEERKSLETQLLQAQKMETIGTLAGGIAHDFNNILSPILICAEIALDDTAKDSEMREMIETIMKASYRAKDLVKRILLFSRSGEQNRETLRIDEVVKEALKLARSSIPSTITISKKIRIKNETITADPIQIHQLIMNLCTNAFHAMQGSGGEIKVELSAINIDNGKNKLLLLNEGKYILLSISDTGHGIDESTKQRIFDPFFTTKDTGTGTGLGLSVVLGIVMSHDGEITVESEVGKGTTFHIYLPQSVRDEASKLPSVDKIDPKGKENVLFVDDESAITFVGKNALEHLGYKVTALNSASEALEMFRLKPDHFNIVISDYTMPNMTGLQLATELKNLNRDIPVIIVSGHNDTIGEENMDRFNIDEYITKPFTGPQLGRAIRKVMDKRER